MCAIRFMMLEISVAEARHRALLSRWRGEGDEWLACLRIAAW